jgi:hypothetical protein
MGIARDSNLARVARAPGNASDLYRLPISINSDYRIFDVAFTDETSMLHSARPLASRGSRIAASLSLRPPSPGET